MLNGRRPLFLPSSPRCCSAPPPAPRRHAACPAKPSTRRPRSRSTRARRRPRACATCCACHRATGKARVVDVRANDGMGTDEFSVVNGVLGGRWIWTTLLSSAAESADARDDRLTDLRERACDHRSTSRTSSPTRRRSRCPASCWSPTRRASSRASPTDARAAGRASRPPRWRPTAPDLLALNGVAQTTTLTLPSFDPARTRPRARTVRKCKPRCGARLVLHTDTFVLTRTGGTSWVCRPARGKTYRLGAVEGVVPVSERHVAYTKPGLIGVFDAVRGSWRELESTSGTVGAALLAAGPGGLRAWAQTRPRRRSSAPSRRPRWRWAGTSPTGSTRPAPPARPTCRTKRAASPGRRRRERRPSGGNRPRC